jgi:hypothetical protein
MNPAPPHPLEAVMGENVELVAVDAGAPDQPLACLRLSSEGLLTCRLAPELSARGPVRLRGFAPPGWSADVLWEPGPEGADAWRCGDEEARNLLAGLSWLEAGGAGSAGNGARYRVQPRTPEAPRFPSQPVRSRLLGTCDREMSLDPSPVRVVVEMDPAVVSIVRIPGDTAGRVRLEYAVQCSGGTVPGMGHVDVEVLPLPGSVESLQRSSDFPARMTLPMRMRYLTPYGRVLSDVETFEARIDEFPPFGVELQPTQAEVRLVHEESGRAVGREYLGPLVALFHLDRPLPPARIPTRAAVAPPVNVRAAT